MKSRLFRFSILLGVLVLIGYTAYSASRPRPLYDNAPPEPEEWLLEDTPYETPVYLLDSGKSGKTVLILGGVHGDEPGGWLAADLLLRRDLPKRGRILVVPRANALAVESGVRSTPALGDLNRHYPGDPDGIPMERMAYAIVSLADRYDADVVLDLHESWSFYVDQASDGVDLASLGQTISPHEDSRSRSLAGAITRRVNHLLSGKLRFIYNRFPDDYRDEIIVPPPPGWSEDDIPRNSGLYISAVLPETASILVEVAQQQDESQRVFQMLLVVEALLRESGM